MRSLYETSATNIFAAKPTQPRMIGWLLSASLAFAATGCGVATEEETATGEEGANLESLVDAQVLENIRSLENGIVSSDLRHEGRIWYSPDLVTTFITGVDGAGMAFTLGDARDYAALDTPLEAGQGAPLLDVVAQQGLDPTHIFTSESGLDIVLFDAQPQAESGIGQETQAISGPQSCPTTFFPQTCNPDNHRQYIGSVPGPSLNDSDRTTSMGAGSSNIEASTIAVCSEVGSQQLVVTTSNPAWGTAPGGTGAGGLTIPQGQIGVWIGIGGWKEREYCSHKVWGVCTEHRWRTLFQDFDFTFSVTPLNSTSEYSFCSATYLKENYTRADECNASNCPAINFGG